MTTGVLVMAYGTPRDRDDVEAYYTDIRRGRPPSPEQLADLQRRYDAIGGTFPLRELTERQTSAIRDALGPRYEVALGTKHSRPSITDGVAALAARGVERAVGLVLAPHYSALSVGDYARRAADAGTGFGLEVDTIESWHLLAAYLDFLARAVRTQLQRMPGGTEVVFTAHSLPQRIADAGDPYPQQLRETAEAVARDVGLRSWSVAWQSAGRTSDTWLGPDVLEVVRDRAARGAPGLVVCACGFVADHLEVAYDLDVEAAGVAREVGLPFARAASVGGDPRVMHGLAELVSRRAAPG